VDSLANLFYLFWWMVGAVASDSASLCGRYARPFPAGRLTAASMLSTPRRAEEVPENYFLPRLPP
jgi:hypothetical protein